MYTQYFLEHRTPPPPEYLVQRGYSPLPGRAAPIPLRKYSCPRGDYDWYRRAAGEPVPRCPTHDLPLKAVD